MGIMVFFIVAILKSVFIEFGMALGLFAVFAILRFRTRNFSLKDMSYIFTTIGVSVINALKLLKFPLLGVLIINAIIVLSVFILEEFLVRNKFDSHSIIYDDLELLKSNKNQKLLKDLSTRTGKDILKFKIRRVDYRREIAVLDVFYKD
jgi:hypothetical protein